MVGTVLVGVLVILIAGAIVFYLACTWFTWQFFYLEKEKVNPTDNSSPSDLPPVSLLVPACGVDAGAWENWTSFCHQDYPQYEVLFGVTDAQDPCIPVLQKLMATYPDRVRLYPGLEPKGINYKDSNLSYLLEQANYDVIVFADSDIRVSPDYLRIVTAPLQDDKVGMVTCAFIGHDPHYLGGALASLSRCVDFVPSLLIARSLDGGLRCAVGATIATERERLAHYGGLQFNRIGSDYNIGKRAAAAGYRVELSPYVLESDTGTETIGQVFQRELRWARTIRFNRGAQYYTMIFCYGTVFCLPLLLLTGFAHWAIALTIATFTLRYLQALVAIVCMQAPRLSRWLWTLPLRDLMTFIIWARGAYGNGVYWRGRKLRIEADGLIRQWGGAE